MKFMDFDTLKKHGMDLLKAALAAAAVAFIQTIIAYITGHGLGNAANAVNAAGAFAALKYKS
jgi:hypothetical protein